MRKKKNKEENDLVLLQEECKIKELTFKQFCNATPKDLGFTGKKWNLDAIIVNGIVVFDRHNQVTQRGRDMFMTWFSRVGKQEHE